MPLPLGAVVATCTLVDVLPMIEVPDEAPEDGRFVYVDSDFIQIHDDDVTEPIYLEDERHLGNYRSGDFAWILMNVTPTTRRCPTCFGDHHGRERAWHDAHRAGWLCDASNGGCYHPACTCPCHTEARCPTCFGRGTCDPIPMRGRQGLWNCGELGQ